MSFFNRLSFLVLLSLPVTAIGNEIKIISMDSVPWAFFDKESNRYSGIFPDLVREIEKQTGHNIKITLSPYARINRELKSGRQDCTVLISESERQKITNLGELAFKIPMGVIANKEFSLNQYEDLYNVRISVLRSLDITKKFTTDSNIVKEYDTAYEMGLRKVLHGRVDAVAGTIPTINYLIKKNNMESMMGTPFVLDYKPIYLQCSIYSKKVDYIKDINDAMRVMRNSGIIDDIAKKYYR